MNWGIKIGIGMGLFVALVITMVTISMQQKDIHLVASDYYEQEIAYQETIDKMNNLEKLGHKPVLEIQGAGVIADFSSLPEFTSIQGKINFFRPSDPALDFNTDIALTNEGKQYVEAGKGKWIVKLSWNNKGTDYYMEQNVVL